MEELIRRKLAREAAEKELEEFVELLRSAKQMPSGAKPQKSSWIAEEKTRVKIESLGCYAIDACKTDDQKKMAGMVLTDPCRMYLLFKILLFLRFIGLSALKWEDHEFDSSLNLTIIGSS